jgi:fluoroacetyl-CoA thioesterase
MSKPIAVGTSREIICKTGAEHTAKCFYENLPPVFATPFLAGFMERACAELINEHLDPGEQSVGISMNLKHTAATPLGMTVRITTEVITVEGAKLTFQLAAWDEAEPIGQAVHERFIINAEKFNGRVAGKVRAKA